MEEVVIKKESQTIKLLKLLLKIAVTVLCFWYISRKIDFTKAEEAFMKADWWWLMLSVLAFAFAKFLASFRLNIYFRNIDIHLPDKKNIKLYWLGMFYNLFLPGAISGDAYKVVLLTKKFDASYKKITAAVLLDRFSGLLALGLIMSVYGVIVLDNNLYDIILISGSVLAVIALYIIVRYFFKDFVPGFWPTFFWGIAVQVLMVICIYCILAGVHQPLHQPEWVFIFLVSSVITVIPISLGGGLGTREFIFVKGAEFFLLDIHVAPIISLLYYLAVAISSLPGVFYIYSDPLKEEG